MTFIRVSRKHRQWIRRRMRRQAPVILIEVIDQETETVRPEADCSA